MEKAWRSHRRRTLSSLLPLESTRLSTSSWRSWSWWASFPALVLEHPYPAHCVGFHSLSHLLWLTSVFQVNTESTGLWDPNRRMWLPFKQGCASGHVGGFSLFFWANEVFVHCVPWEQSGPAGMWVLCTSGCTSVSARSKSAFQLHCTTGTNHYT